MDEKLPDKFNLAGTGYGSYLAGLFASSHPDKVSRLMLLNPADFCPSEFNPNVDRNCHPNLASKSVPLESLVDQGILTLQAEDSSLGRKQAKTISNYKAMILKD